MQVIGPTAAQRWLTDLKAVDERKYCFVTCRQCRQGQLPGQLLQQCMDSLGESPGSSSGMLPNPRNDLGLICYASCHSSECWREARLLRPMGIAKTLTEQPDT